jgi:hypothetical protein
MRRFSTVRRQDAFILIYWLIIFWLAVTPHALAAQPDPVSQQPEVATPSPTVAVQKLLDQAAQQLQAKRALDVIGSAEQAIALAQQTGDQAGLAQGWQQKAEALGYAQRFRDASAAFKTAAEAWSRIGAGDRQAEALGESGLMLGGDDDKAANALTAQAVAVAQLEQRRPRAAAALNRLADEAQQYGLLDMEQLLAGARSQ